MATAKMPNSRIQNRTSQTYGWRHGLLSPLFCMVYGFPAQLKHLLTYMEKGNSAATLAIYRKCYCQMNASRLMVFIRVVINTRKLHLTPLMHLSSCWFQRPYFTLRSQRVIHVSQIQRCTWKIKLYLKALLIFLMLFYQKMKVCSLTHLMLLGVRWQQ